MKTSANVGEYRLGISCFNGDRHVMSDADYLEVDGGPNIIDDMITVCNNLAGQYDEVRFDIRCNGALVKRGKAVRKSNARKRKR